MKKFIISVILFIICVSCRKDPYLEILIQNRTDQPIHVTLFPKENIVDGDFFSPCDGCRENKPIQYTLWSNKNKYSNWDEVLYTSSDLNINPYTTILNRFDSVIISLEDGRFIKFTKDTVIGFSDNVFKHNNLWEYEVTERARSGFTLTKFHLYTFPISENNFIMSNSTE